MSNPTRNSSPNSGLPYPAGRKPESCVVVVFGATGYLMRRKLMPAIYNLANDGFLPDPLVVVGVGRREMLQN